MKNNLCPIKESCRAGISGDCFTDFLQCEKFKEYAKTHKKDLVIAKATTRTVDNVAKQKTVTDDLFGSVEDAVFEELDEKTL